MSIGEPCEGNYVRNRTNRRSAPPFWAEAAEAVLRRSPGGSEGGQVNSCYNALDRHVENGRADQLALIYGSRPALTAASAVTTVIT
jgi:hypothetical protein